MKCKSCMALSVALFVALGTASAGAEEPVKIGVLADLSGSSVDIGGPGSIAAVNLAVKDFGGTVAGRLRSGSAAPSSPIGRRSIPSVHI